MDFFAYSFNKIDTRIGRSSLLKIIFIANVCILHINYITLALQNDINCGCH